MNKHRPIEEAAERITFDPIGTSHELQKNMTTLMHNLILADGKCTLSELGYLHMNTLLFNQTTQALELKVYFDARFAARTVLDNMNKKHVVPVQELNVFQNYLYVGQLTDVVTFEEVMGPKGEVIDSGRNKASLKLKGNGKLAKYRALELNCNIPISLAAICDVNLSDTTYQLEILNDPARKDLDDIVVSVSKNTIPVSVRVSYSPMHCGYEPDLAVSYLSSLLNKGVRRDSHRAELVQKVKKTAKANKQKAKDRTERGFGRYG